MIEICRDHSSNVKRWRDGQMALRWCAAGMVEAGKQFRKVNGFLHLPALRKALDDYVGSGVTPIDYNKEETQPEHHRAATEVLRNSGHPPGVTYRRNFAVEATSVHSFHPSGLSTSSPWTRNSPVLKQRAVAR